MRREWNLLKNLNETLEIVCSAAPFLQGRAALNLLPGGSESAAAREEIKSAK